MKINIYINGKPIAEYEPEELNKIKIALTVKAMQAAGYVPAEAD